MAYETYPKGSKHPSSSVGEQEGKGSWNDANRNQYPNTTVKDTVYNGEIAKTKHCVGGGASTNIQVSAFYPKSREKFGSERHVGS